ncbi:the UvrABC repair system catalyzes the recognition and processing of DNA lesions [Arthrobacter sp. Hiyo4]|nr:the UvrABC repair system catalyzes the recognition and processing of DNA lesions [Arthrobacter sp. Hiyo4]
MAKPYKGRFWSAKSYVLHTLADSQSAAMRERVLAFMESGRVRAAAAPGSGPKPSRSLSAAATSPTSTPHRWRSSPKSSAPPQG